MSLQTPQRTSERPVPRSRRDLLRYPLVVRLLSSRLYPGVLQAAVAALFVGVGYELLTGPSSAHDNAGTAWMWVAWWPLIPVAFVLLGRFWCAVCPFATINDLVQRFVGVQRPVPAWLKKYGIWIIDALFILITWADHVFGIVGSPWGSGILVLLLTTAVIASGAFFQRRAFCRYLCPIGGLSGNYARTGMVALRAEQSICATCTSRAVCFNGGDKAPECPLWQFPRTMDSNANCNLCANCLKNCPNDAITLELRPPTTELWTVRKPKVEESFLAMAIMGIVLVQNVTMLTWWEGVLSATERLIGLHSEALIFTLVFAVAVSIPVAALTGAARIARAASGESVLKGFARFGYALIPLDVAGHIAHNLFHLLAEGGALWLTTMPLFGYEPTGSAALASTGTIQVLQYVILGLGTWASVYAALRIARSRHGRTERARQVVRPYIVLIATFAALNAWLFALPMAHRM